MKIYSMILLAIATAITLVAVAAGAIVILRAKYGSNNPVFQLARIGVLWVAAILLLLLGGLTFFTVTDWTSTALQVSLEKTWTWAKSNRMMASILLWSASILTVLLLNYLGSCTMSVAFIVATLHVWATYTIWANPVWPTIKAVVLLIVIVCYEGDCGFQRLQVNKPDHSVPVCEPERQIQGAEVPESAGPAEVLGNIIADCADKIGSIGGVVESADK